MSQFQIPIPNAVRERMSVSPPPAWSQDGEVLPVPEAEVRRYADLRLMKQRAVVRIEEDIDDTRWGVAGHNYILGVVCMPNDADLKVILAAARHLGLLERYELIRDYKERLDERYEKNFVEIRVSVGCEVLRVTSDVVDGSPRNETFSIMLSLGERRQIWLGLFEAAGYRVQWGGTLNVRKTHI